MSQSIYLLGLTSKAGHEIKKSFSTEAEALAFKARVDAHEATYPAYVGRKGSEEQQEEHDRQLTAWREGHPIPGAWYPTGPEDWEVLALPIEGVAAVSPGEAKEPSNREKIEAAGLESCLVSAPLYALQHGFIASYQETLELMVLSLVKHNGELMRKLVSAELARPHAVYGTNSGHGHVWARPDGVKVDCGGPKSCGACASEVFIAERVAPGTFQPGQTDA